MRAAHRVTGNTRTTRSRRWFAVPVAAVLTAVLTFGGVAPAMADATPRTDALKAKSVLMPTASSIAAQIAGGVAFTATIKPTSSTTVIRVNKEVLRGKTDHLAGATFRLYDGGSDGPTTPANLGVGYSGSCTIQSGDTSCDIEVPKTNVSQASGGNNGRRYWVVETASAPGTFALGNIATGSATNLTATNPYPGRTDAMVANEVQHMPRPGSDNLVSIKKTVNALKNPKLIATCSGLDIILVLDMSGSVTAAQRTVYADGLETLVKALQGTGTRVSVVTFNTGASNPAFGITNLTSADDSGLINKLRTGVTTAGNYANATNWDLALQKAADLASAAGASYDLVMMVTDGAPNYNRDNTSSTNVRFQAVENAVLSANAIKAQKIPVYAVGVGNAVTNDRGKINLRSITDDDDYFVGGWDALGSILKGIAQAATCRVGIAVNKTEIDEFGAKTEKAGGWEFSAKKAEGSDGTLSTPEKATTPADGSVEWVHQFSKAGQNATVRITETQKPGWALQGVTCNDEPVTVKDGAWSVSFTLGASIVCTVTNVKNAATGSVTKTAATPVQAADGTWSIDYTITVTSKSATAAYPYTLNDTLQYGGGFTPGTASVVDSPASGATLTAGWTGLGAKTELATGTVPAGGKHEYTIRVAGTTIANGTQNGSAWKCVENPGTSSKGGFLNRVDLLDAKDKIVGTDYACKEPAFPKVQKSPGAAPTYDAVTGAWTVNYTISVQNPSNSVDLQASLSDTLPTLPTGWSLDGSWTATPTGGAPAPTNATSTGSPWTIWSGTLPKSTTYTYTVSAKIEPGVDATPIGTCDDGKGGGLINSATVTSGLIKVTDKACVTIDTPPVSITKSDGTAMQLSNGDWQIDYTITVSNASTIGTVYTLSDTPQLGSGWTLVSGTWQGEAPAANTPIAGGASHDYTYRVIARVTPVDAGTPQPSLVCTTEGENPGGAFYNVATVHYPGGPVEGASDDGCAVPAAPTVTKTAQAASQNAVTGNWTLAYTVTVNNPSSLTLAYTLSDTAAALPVGVTPIGDWTVTGPVTGGQGTGTLEGGWNGAGVLATGHFPAGATHSYTVQRVVQIAASVADAALSCGDTSGTGGGFWNEASVTNGVGGNDDDACVTIDRPGVSIAKTVTGVSQLDDGTWQIAYQVVATNLSQTLAARYNLSDTLAFGGGITILSGADAPKWTGPSNGTFSGNTATLAANKLLAPAASDTYTVTVKATIDAAGWAGDALVCKPGENPDAGGFLNTVTLTVNGTTKKADDCATPKLPEVTKTGTSVEQDATDPEKWLVSYELTVYPSGFDTFYTLADIPGFASGVTLGAGTAQRVGTDEVLSITSGGAFPASAVPLGAAETHTWTVTWQATITGAGVTPPADECGDEYAAGKGFYNQVELRQGVTVIDDDEACLPITPRVYPTVTKTATSVMQGPDAQWTITYDVVVRLAANEKNLSAVYNLSDALRFGAGITITEASWAGETSGTFAGSSATLATGRTIASGATHSYTVTAKATVTADALNGDTTECLSGETPENGGFLNSTTLVSGGQTAHDHACAEPLFPAVSKTGQAATQNDDGSWNISYLVTVSVPSTDATPAPPAVVFTLSDAPALPDGVELADETVWSVAGQDAAASATVTAATWDGEGTWTVATGQLAPGASLSYVVSTKVNVLLRASGHTFSTCDDTDKEGISLPNTAAVASGAFSDSDTGCTTVLPAPRWTVSKSSVAPSGSTVRPGDEVVYTISVLNTGQVPLVGAVVTDDLTDVIDDATLTLPLAAGLELSDEGDTLTWQVPEVPVGETPVTISYTVVVKEDAWGVTLNNVITGDGPVPPTNCGIAPLVSLFSHIDCHTEHFTPRWELHKDSDPVPGSLIPVGSIVTYILTVTNVGPVPVVGSIVIDDMSAVLPYADMHGDLDPALHFDPDAETVVWTLPDIPVGESVQITYQVKVHEDAYGITIFNVAAPGDPSGSCPVQCSTNKRTGVLSSTGLSAPAGQWSAIALAMMLLGGALLAARVITARRLAPAAPAGAPAAAGSRRANHAARAQRDAAPARRSTYLPPAP